MGDGGFGTLTVREDDGDVTSPAFGTPGDACAEYAASLEIAGTDCGSVLSGPPCCQAPGGVCGSMRTLHDAFVAICEKIAYEEQAEAEAVADPPRARRVPIR